MVAPPGSAVGQGGLPHSPVYDPRRPQTYFQQCFQLLGTLGRGSYGEVYKVGGGWGAGWGAGVWGGAVGLSRGAEPWGWAVGLRFGVALWG